jgi:hypothetical protein
MVFLRGLKFELLKAMPTSMKTTVFAFLISIFLTPGTGICAKTDLKIVTRVDLATAVMKGRKLIIHAQGVAPTAAHFSTGGRLLSHNNNHQPNKEGLLEYDLCFNPPRNNSGDKLKPVKANLKESSVPDGVKGARIFGELNQLDAMPPERKKKKK